MTNLAASAVALVVLVDLATGQGPPVYTNYLQQQENYRPPPPPMHPVAYVHRSEYDPRKIEKDYEKAVELGKVGDQKERKKFEKEYDKHQSDGGKEYSNKDKKEDGSSPGMFSSLSDRMSGAWKSISSFGREKRAVDDQLSNTSTSADDQVSSPNKIFDAPTSVPTESVTSNLVKVTSKARGIDNHEHLQYKNQGYIYFKVPKYLICGQ